MKEFIGKVIEGDCLEIMKTMDANSIDTIITDPPYGLEFMGKNWDSGVPGIPFWEEMLRVTKPGGTLLSFGGTRTYHRMACNIEDAGFDIFDTIYWHYASGFPKSYNIAKGITKQFDKIRKIVYNEYESKYTICKNSNNANTVEQSLQKNQTEIGTHILKSDFVVVDVSLISKEIINQNLSAIIAELNLEEVNHLSEQESIIVQRNVETKIKQKLLNVKIVEKNLEIRNQTKENIAQSPATIYQCGKIMDKIKVEEVLKIELGNLLLLKKTITSVNYAELIENLKLIILNQSKTFQSLDTKNQTELLTATNVIITKSTMECLISSTESILDKERKNWTGWGTALKPATEPIICARKKVDTNYVLNALCWKVSGLNIDGGRIGMSEEDIKTNKAKASKEFIGVKPFGNTDIKGSALQPNSNGRFPANIILDEEAGKMLDKQSGELKSGSKQANQINYNHKGKEFVAGMGSSVNEYQQNQGGASRFFYCAKASKSERNAGCEELEEKDGGHYAQDEWSRKNMGNCPDEKRKPTKNNHPTVKPIKLMEYLCTLTKTPTGGIVLDPFAGSGSTLLACQNTDRDYIGIEKEEEYVKIIKSRLKGNKIQGKLLWT